MQHEEHKNLACPFCWQLMFQVYFGDDVERWRCMDCNVVIRREEIEQI